MDGLKRSFLKYCLKLTNFLLYAFISILYLEKRRGARAVNDILSFNQMFVQIKLNFDVI